MDKGRKIGSAIVLCIALALLILDTKSAIAGVEAGIELCIRTVIPALFPFLILSPLLVSSIPRVTFFRPLGKLLGIPAGGEPIVLGGILCGYPVGARMVCDAWKSGQLSQEDARRMLAFCNNAGPAFIFGIGSSLFSDNLIPWLLWGIHILSALLLGFLLPGKSKSSCNLDRTAPITFRIAVEQSVLVMARICGWIIVFRTILSFLNRWILWLFPTWLKVLICGSLELANGCTALHQINDPSVRFLFMSAFLAFGGMSVHMQTASVTPGLNATTIHILGKLMSMSISLFLAATIQAMIYQTAVSYWVLVLSAAVITLSIFIIRRKRGSIPQLCGV